jgi:hypothetical protein
MTARTFELLRLLLSAAAGIICLFVNDNLSSTKLLMTQADARVENPRTPGSAAGVARRTARRAVVGVGVFNCRSDVHYIPGGYWAPGPCYYGPPPPVRYCTFEFFGWNWCWRP